jgi:hypothetical protein
MMQARRLIWLFGIVAVIAGWGGPGDCEATAPPRKGGQLPPLTLAAPATQKDCDYLGIDAGQSFTLADVKADLLVIEIIGVYCPQCHHQRPHINRLYHRVQKDARLAETVKFIGIAVGASAMEAAYLVRDAHIPYPIIIDESFVLHKQLGEPRTPFNLVATRQGQVVWDHLGIIKDMDAFYATLKSLAGQ